MNKQQSLVAFILIIIFGGILVLNRGATVPTDKIKSEDTGDIKEGITYDNATSDLIQVELPFPGAVTGKSFSVIGKARGNWFFEATFPITVLDKDGKVLVQTYASAEGEWMTTDFVSFRGEVNAPIDYIGPATLILHKSNASDMRELDASISFPINIEY